MARRVGLVGSRVTEIRKGNEGAGHGFTRL